MDERAGGERKGGKQAHGGQSGYGEFGGSLRVWSSEGVLGGGTEDPVRSLVWSSEGVLAGGTEDPVRSLVVILASWEDPGLRGSRQA